VTVSTIDASMADISVRTHPAFESGNNASFRNGRSSALISIAFRFSGDPACDCVPTTCSTLLFSGITSPENLSTETSSSGCRSRDGNVPGSVPAIESSSAWKALAVPRGFPLGTGMSTGADIETSSASESANWIPICFCSSSFAINGAFDELTFSLVAFLLSRGVFELDDSGRISSVTLLERVLTDAELRGSLYSGNVF